MIQQYFQMVFISIFYLAVVLLILIVIAASWIDFKNLALQTVIAKLPKNTKHHPITVIVYAKNNAATIKATLTSIIKTNYLNVKIVVVDNVSTDSTTDLVSEFQKDNQSVDIVFITKRKHSSRQQSLLQAFKKSAANSHVVVVNGDAILQPNTLSDANKALKVSENKIYQVATQITFSQSYRSFTKTLILLSYDKFLAIKRHFIPSKTSPLQLFACRNVVFKKQVSSYKAEYESLKKIALPVIWILFVLTSIYFLYISLAFQKSDLLIYSFVVLFAWLCFVIISSEQLRFQQKVSLATVLPASYLLFITLPFVSLLELLPRDYRSLTD